MHTPPRSKAKAETHAGKSLIARKMGLVGLDYVHTAELGGAVLLLAAILALGWANSPWKQSYYDLFNTPIVVKIGNFDVAVPEADEHTSEDGTHAAEKDEEVSTTEPDDAHPSEGMTLHHWINDALMVLFFFVVGLEIKRELVHGELAGVRRAALPVIIAMGGMIMPALLFLVLNLNGPGRQGWGIPMATDIAFALGTLALLGNRVGPTIRVLLLAFAIADDIGAILVIALFYTEKVSWTALIIAVALVALVLIMQRLGVLDIGPYIFVGGLLWVAMIASGVHATIAGVVLGLLTPASPWFSLSMYRSELSQIEVALQRALDENRTEDAEYYLGRIEKLTAGTEAVLDRLIRLVHPWSAFLVLPIFALANAGVTLDSQTVTEAVRSPVSWGIVLGLALGKPIGTALFAWVAVRLGIVELPREVSWGHLIGIGLLGGIGFTVALFIADLAFDSPTMIAQAKIGILLASLVSAIAGFLYLRLSQSPRPTEHAHG